MRKHKWNYKHLIILGLSIIFAVYILTSDIMENFILSMGNFSYLGSLITGFFFSFAFTTAPASASAIILGKTANPILIGLIGGFGAMLADFSIFYYIKYKIDPDINYLMKKFKINEIKKIRHTKLGWILPVLGAIIIGSPLPDELGSFLLGISHYSTKKFLIISYIMNSLGIMLLASIGQL